MTNNSLFYCHKWTFIHHWYFDQENVSQWSFKPSAVSCEHVLGNTGCSLIPQLKGKKTKSNQNSPHSLCRSQMSKLKDTQINTICPQVKPWIHLVHTDFKTLSHTLSNTPPLTHTITHFHSLCKALVHLHHRAPDAAFRLSVISALPALLFCGY